MNINFLARDILIIFGLFVFAIFAGSIYEKKSISSKSKNIEITHAYISSLINELPVYPGGSVFYKKISENESPSKTNILRSGWDITLGEFVLIFGDEFPVLEETYEEFVVRHNVWTKEFYNTDYKKIKDFYDEYLTESRALNNIKKDSYNSFFEDSRHKDYSICIRPYFGSKQSEGYIYEWNPEGGSASYVTIPSNTNITPYNKGVKIFILHRSYLSHRDCGFYI